MHRHECPVTAAMDWKADLQPYIFTCAVCSRPVHDIYNDDPELNGLSDDTETPDSHGQHRKSEPVTFESLGSKKVAAKVWFFPDCAHLLCSGHLPGGGVPFYPSGSSPKAECPICSVDEPKDLFPLYSSRIGELDPRIPRKYFEKADLAVLNEAVPGCDVIKFQFENLLQFAGHMLHQMNAMKSALAVREKPSCVDDEYRDDGDSAQQDRCAKPPSLSCSTASNDQYISTGSGACTDSLSSIISPTPSQLTNVEERNAIEETSLQKSAFWKPFSRPCLRNQPSETQSPSLHRPESGINSIVSNSFENVGGGGGCVNDTPKAFCDRSVTTPESLKRASKHEFDSTGFLKPDLPASRRLTMPTSWSNKWHSQMPSNYNSPSPVVPDPKTNDRENRKKSRHLPPRLDLSVINHNRQTRCNHSSRISPSKWRIPPPFSTAPSDQRAKDAADSPLRRKRRHSSIGNLDRGLADIQVEPAFISDVRISATPRKPKTPRRCSENGRAQSILWDLSARFL